jgi:hypothetical protein
MSSSVRLAAVEHGGHATVPQDHHAVRDVNKLGEVARIEEDGVASGGEVPHHEEDLAFRADVHARVGSKRRRTRASVRSILPKTTFC